MSICIRYIPNQDEAMEAVNDSYLKLFDNLNGYDKSKPFKSWFAKIIVNTAIDSYRKNLKHSSLVSISNALEQDEKEPEIVQELSAEEIIKLLAKLPDNLRITFNLYEIEGYSHEEIGEILGIAESSSRANLTRAKQILRTLYMQHFNPETQCHEAV
jgi:RNA polymerase sigma-70 factor (ECF subfamily)